MMYIGLGALGTKDELMHVWRLEFSKVFGETILSHAGHTW